MKILKATRIAPGIVSGPVFFFERNKWPIPRYLVASGETDRELRRFQEAIAKADQELNQVRGLVLSGLSKEHALLIDAQLMALRDTDLHRAVETLVCQRRYNILRAYVEVMTRYAKTLAETVNAYHQERLVDLHDVMKRVIHHLSVKRDYTIPRLREPAIFVSERLSPTDLINLHNQRALGIVTQVGGVDSHAGILARAFNLPYVSGLLEMEELRNCPRIILDADEEAVHLNPSRETELTFSSRLQAFRQTKEQISFQKAPPLPMVTEKVEVLMNASFVTEIEAVAPTLFPGIGLFRTEFLCLERNAIPDEQTQYRAYTKILNAARGKIVTFRTFDFGREKLFALLNIEALQKESALDNWGGIGFCLDNPEILITQLRALFRASRHGAMQIMIPLVTGIDQIRATLAITEAARANLGKTVAQASAKIPFGIMVETDTIIEQLDEAAKLVDFFSVGTNDLALFLLGSRRDATLVKNYYHPLIFRALDKIITAGQRHNIPVTVCGEMAADPFGALGLLALGYHSLSINANALPTIRELASSLDLHALGQLRTALIEAADAISIYNLLKDFRNRASHPD